MVTQQILVLFFLVRIQVAQLFILLLLFIIGLWCNGTTTDSGPDVLGSKPGSPTEEDRLGDLFFVCAACQFWMVLGEYHFPVMIFLLLIDYFPTIIYDNAFAKKSGTAS